MRNETIGIVAPVLLLILAVLVLLILLIRWVCYLVDVSKERRIDVPRCCRCKQAFREGQPVVTSAEGELSHAGCAKQYFRSQRRCVVLMGAMASVNAVMGTLMVVDDLTRNLAASRSFHLSYADMEFSILSVAGFLILFLIRYWKELRRQADAELHSEQIVGADPGSR